MHSIAFEKGCKDAQKCCMHHVPPMLAAACLRVQPLCIFQHGAAALGVRLNVVQLRVSNCSNITSNM